MGEGFGRYALGDDEALMQYISSANIACGFHAGDPRIMERVVAGAARRGIGIGAHVGFPDLVGFGRRNYDPLLLPYKQLVLLLEEKEEHLADIEMPPSRVVYIPTCYGGEFGPDLDFVAQHAGLEPEQVILG